jgi:MFS family permease
MTVEDGQSLPLSETVLETTKHDPYAALRYRDFRLLSFGRVIAALGEQMLGVAVGWELYERTGSAFALGLVGLVQVLPVITLSLWAGHAADRYNRKKVLLLSQLLLAACSLGLAYLSFTQGSLLLVYMFLLLIGVGRAFNSPASSALLPQTVPPEVFPSAATWSSSTWQFAAVFGPALGGLMIAVFNSAVGVYLIDGVAALIYVIFVSLIRGKRVERSREAFTFKAMISGFQFIRQNKVILAAVTLDMFAVLFGGAVALLPVYAKDILQVGSEGLGWLRAAPSIGAMMMVLVITYMPPFKRAGRALLWAVIGFGIATIVFGVSRSFLLSMAALITLGAMDNISVVVRMTLLLTRSPDEMRGRVSAVNNVFIGMSNELGAFESGVTAAMFGPVLAVILGGIGTILVVLGVARTWPEIGQLGALNEQNDVA